MLPSFYFSILMNKNRILCVGNFLGNHAEIEPVSQIRIDVDIIENFNHVTIFMEEKSSLERIR